MSSTIDTHAHYLKSHEWARLDAATGEVVIGISDHAQQSLSDLVYVELPRVGDHKDAGDVFGVVESVKAASDVYMPLGGTIAAVNSDLEGAPETINKAPFGDGWLIRIKPDNAKDLDALLDAKAYGEFLETEEGH